MTEFYFHVTPFLAVVHILAILTILIRPSITSAIVALYEHSFIIFRYLNVLGLHLKWGQLRKLIENKLKILIVVFDAFVEV